MQIKQPNFVSNSRIIGQRKPAGGSVRREEVDYPFHFVPKNTNSLIINELLLRERPGEGCKDVS